MSQKKGRRSGGKRPARPQKSSPKSAQANDDLEGFEEYTPSGKKDTGPSMKERLLAARRGEDLPEPAAKPAALEEEAPAKIPAKRAPKKVAGKVRQSAAKAKAKAEEALEEASDKVEAKAKQASAAAMAKATEVKRAAAEKVEDAKEAVAEKASEAKQAVKKATRPAVQRAKAGAKKAGPVVRKAGAKMAAATEEVADKLDGDDKPARKPAASRRPAASARKGVARSGGAASRRAKDKDSEEGAAASGGRRARREAPPEKSKAPLILGGVGAAVLAVGAWQFLGSDDTANAGAGTDPAATTPAEAPEGGDSEELAAGMGSGAGEETPQPEDAPEEAAPEEGAASDIPELPKTPDAEDLPPTEVPRNSSGRQKMLASMADNLYIVDDPAEPQFDQFERFGPTEDTTEEEWADIEKQVGRMFDPMAGAAGNRARIKLQETYGKKAFPAIINGLLGLDYATEDGNRSGDVGQKALQVIANGRNVGWKYGFDEEPNKVHIANKRYVEKLYQIWQRVLGEPEYWERYAKIKQKAKAEDEDELADDLDGAPDDLDDLDPPDDL